VEAIAGARVVLGVTGGIGAYKAALLARLLVGAGATVDAVLTRGARQLIGPATFEGLTGRPVRTEVFEGVDRETHVALGRDADLVIVYPATAHTLARMAAGLADDLLTTTLLVARCPVLVAPAMHTEMWEHPATRANLATLRARGVEVVGPVSGPLMGADVGLGRLVEPDEAMGRVRAALGSPAGVLEGRTVLVTAGGTREPIDPVRFLGNRSSGKMGFAVAAAAAAAGAKVVLVAAPSALPTPPGVDRVDVMTAREMRDAVLDAVAQADVVVKAAAVADFRPDDASATKLKKDAGVPTIRLVANPDILAELATRRGENRRPLLVGFAAETDDVEANARRKIAAKGADLLVVNDVSRDDAGFEVDDNRVALLDRDGQWQELPADTKDALAGRIVEDIARRLEA
jgi:phosphopantothenoylcysteine decarboxylase / phosphopantothenate---cysteine ligase